MADLKCTIAGIASINPFWLASAPPTDKKYNVVRTFEAGWGGVVWKTLGIDPPVVNMSSRYGAHHDANRGINTWRDAAEFIALGASGVQVCTAAMLFGFRIVEDMIEGLSNFMDKKSYKSINYFRGMAVPNTINWDELNINFDLKAKIDKDNCIECGRCFIACEYTSHQAITKVAKPGGGNEFTVIDDECVGCNLCLYVCPVTTAITINKVDNGLPHLTWPEHPNNPMRDAVE